MRKKRKQYSKQQRNIFFILKSIYPKTKIIFNDHKSIYPFDLDVYFPSIKFAIEYDGEYWHYSPWAIKKGSLKAMKKKNMLCADSDITLIRIREKDWLVEPQKELQKIIDLLEKMI